LRRARDLIDREDPAGVTYERDGPLLRAVGGHRGYICGPRDIGVTGAELDRLPAGRVTRTHPKELTENLAAAGLSPGDLHQLSEVTTAE
jgi:hypothetical protein